MAIEIENDLTTSVEEVDKEGGWLVTHWTHTWDERQRLDTLQEARTQLQKSLDDTQAKIEKVDAVLADVAITTK